MQPYHCCCLLLKATYIQAQQDPGREMYSKRHIQGISTYCDSITTQALPLLYMGHVHKRNVASISMGQLYFCHFLWKYQSHGCIMHHAWCLILCSASILTSYWFFLEMFLRHFSVRCISCSLPGQILLSSWLLWMGLIYSVLHSQLFISLYK